MTTPLRPAVIVFDVNGTLLDLARLGAALTAAVGADVQAEWSARLLHGSLVANHLGRYRSFEDIGVDALVRIAGRHGASLDRDHAGEIVATIRSAPAYPDVVPALDRLARAGYRIAALTNSAADTVTAQLGNAGLDVAVTSVVSVDEVRRFKPAPEVYLMAAVRFGVDLDEMLMVSANDWDVLGAASVGIPGAFVTRPGSLWATPDPAPDLVVPDLDALADKLEA